MEPDVLTGLRFASALPLLGVIAATQSGYGSYCWQ
jgi:ABC-type nitrate/sulfonate/bicarbonate transport system permease component